MEYKIFAKFYDKFYSKKDYVKEVNFLKYFIDKGNKVLDVGCGTGNHALLLEKESFSIDGLDLSQEMIDIAKSRLSGNLYKQDILNMKLDKKYNTIISMFAVINHLKNIEELEKTLINFKEILLPKGKIIIDLHNPQKSGFKIDEFDNIKRTMIWEWDKKTKIETSDIIFEIDGQKYKDSHVFRIFTIEEVINCCKNIGLKVVKVYENYDIKKVGSKTSKNLQFIIERD